MSLANKRVVVIGGSAGMGYATAQAALSSGAHVVIASRSADKLSAARSALGAAGATAFPPVTHEGPGRAFFKNAGPLVHL